MTVVRWLTFATVTAALAAHVAAWATGSPQPDLVQSYSILALTALVTGGAIGLLGYLFWLGLWEKEARPTPRIIGVCREAMKPQFLVRRVAPMFLTFAFLGAFSALKVLIPTIQPFAYDAAFSDLDRFFFGTDPWRLTHAWIGASGTRLIAVAYGLWLPVLGLAVFGFSLVAPQEAQRRFFFSLFSIWAVLGLGIATLLSSAGPCFLDLIGHPYAARYGELFPLQNAPGAAFAQAYLAGEFTESSFGFGAGISAMPSLHVAVVTLYLLVARKPFWITLSAAYFILILIGSVHLGWHYAVDGILASLGTVCIYAMTASVRREQPVLIPGEASLST